MTGYEPIKIRKIGNLEDREFNIEMQHLGKREGMCYPKWLWEQTFIT